MGEKEQKQKQDSLSGPEGKEDRPAFVWGTALVAAGVVVMLIAVAALVFFVIAGFAQGNWLLVIGGIAASLLILWFIDRLVRVAANQNRLTKKRK